MLYIYKDFVLQSILTDFTNLKWVRKYNSVGDFELTLPFRSDTWELLAVDNVIYKKDTNEGAFIKDRNIFRDSEGNERIVIRGKFLNYILDLRIVSYAGTVTLQKAITDMINQNMISASNSKRNIANFKLVSSAIKTNPNVSLEIENRNLLEVITELAQQFSIGFRVIYNVKQKSYDFELYEGSNRTDVIFAYGFGNVLEQEYWHETSTYKNTCLVDKDGTITIVNDNNAGLNRKETYMTLNTSSTASETEQGILHLQSSGVIESMDTVIDNNSVQFKYLEDWNVGDITTCKNHKWNITIQRNLLEIEEYYDTTGKYLTVVFGDYIPTIKERM